MIAKRFIEKYGRLVAVAFIYDTTLGKIEQVKISDCSIYLLNFGFLLTIRVQYSYNIMLKNV